MLRKYFSKIWLIRYLHLFFKFNFFIEKKLKNISFIKEENISNKKIFIPLIETNHYQTFQILILAKALEKRGIDVVILVCNQFLTACEIKNSNTNNIDPCLECRYNSKKILPYFNLKLVKIEDFIDKKKLNDLKKIANSLTVLKDKIYYDDFNISKIIDDSVLRYFYGNIPNNSIASKVRYDQILTTLINFEFAKIFFNKWKPNIVLNNMNVYSCWEPYFLMAKKYKIQTNIISLSTFDFNKIVLNRIDLYNSNSRFEKWISKRNKFNLNTNENDLLNDFLSSRFKGNSEIFKKSDVFNSEKQDLSKILNIDSSKKNIFLFTNLFWDVGISDSSKLYKGVIDWVIDTIKIIQENPNINLYIKPHPVEVFDTTPSKKGVIQFILDHFKHLPKNIFIIDPKLKIKTYDLFEFIDLGIVYNGTVGIEMLFNNIPIIVTGKAPYSYLNSVINPVNRIEYIKTIFNSKKGESHIDIEEIKLFAYFYFVKNLIPWNLTKKAYADNFKGYNISDHTDLEIGKNKFLDHICNTIIQPDAYNIEDWDEFHLN